MFSLVVLVTIVTVFLVINEIDNLEVQKPSQKCLDAFTGQVLKVYMTPKDAHNSIIQKGTQECTL